MRANTSILAVAATDLLDDHELALDELLFHCARQALREACVHPREVEYSVLASLDVYDGRSISAGLTIPAIAGVGVDFLRIESDAGEAVIAAVEAIESGDVDLAVAAAVFNPEVHDHRTFLAQTSNYSFDPFAGRPVGLTNSAAIGLQDTFAHELGGSETLDPFDKPHHKLLPHRSAAVAVVLSSDSRAQRAPKVRARITGCGLAANTSNLHSTAWLTDPAFATRAAAAAAYEGAGLGDPEAEVDVVELTAPTSRLERLYLEALGLRSLERARVNPSGGARTKFAGVANGGIRMLEALDWLEANPTGRTAVVHSSGLFTGPLADAASVIVMRSC